MQIIPVNNNTILRASCKPTSRQYINALFIYEVLNFNFDNGKTLTFFKHTFPIH